MPLAFNGTAGGDVFRDQPEFIKALSSARKPAVRNYIHTLSPYETEAYAFLLSFRLVYFLLGFDQITTIML